MIGDGPSPIFVWRERARGDWDEGADSQLNGETGATIHFVFVDAGEPGKNDTALIQIWDAAGNLALEVSGFIDVGNLQAHKD